MRDLVANRNQDFLASFGQAQKCITIRLEKFAGGTSAVNGMLIRLTWTILAAARILIRILAASCNPGTDANCRRSTPVERASWPILVAKKANICPAKIMRDNESTPYKRNRTPATVCSFVRVNTTTTASNMYVLTPSNDTLCAINDRGGQIKLKEPIPLI